jgi:hypothetical protein
MIDDMGIFRTTVSVSALDAWDRRADLTEVVVDTGSEYNWIPAAILERVGVRPVRSERFEAADGRILERRIAPAAQRTLMTASSSGRRARATIPPARPLRASGTRAANASIARNPDLLRCSLIP